VKIQKIAGAATIVSLVVAQAFRIDKSNPSVVSDVNAPPWVSELMRRSCYDCHSNEVVWPWYADLAPVSWLIGYDVNEGREDLNFSVWGTYRPATRQKMLKEIAETISEGEMPPWYYIYTMHMESPPVVSGSRHIIRMDFLRISDA
jgi:Haem-binding domain